MARGRHARRSGWLRWLWPTAAPAPRWRDVHARSLVRLCDELTAQQAEVALLRAAAEGSTAAEVAAALRAQGLEEQPAATRTEAAALRRDLDALREVARVDLRRAAAAVDAAPVQRRRVARRSG